MPKPLPCLIALLLAACACFAAEERDCVIDRCEDPALWGVNPGWEFPGGLGTVSAADDGAGGQCVRLDYDFRQGGRYITASRSLEVSQASAVSFRFREDGANSGFIRIADSTGQEHAAGFAVEGQDWRTVRLNLDQAAFGAHWGGANDGEFHFPLTTIIIGVNMGPNQQGACFIDNLTFRTGAAELHYHVSLRTRDPGDVVFATADPVPVEVQLDNAIDEDASLMLRVTGESWHGERRELFAREVTLPAVSSTRETVTLPGEPAEYWALEAELLRGAEVVTRSQGAVVIVDQPRNFGQDDPTSFFAIQNSSSGARTERLGVKWVRAGRDWRWAEMQRGKCWLPDLSEVRANHQLIMYTMTAYPPAWAEERAADNDFWVGEGADERIAWWAAFVEHSARELAPMVDTFEIQNEPDLTCMWQVGLDFARGTERYARILESAASAVRRGAPGARVGGIDVSGGDYDGGLHFSDAMMASHGGSIDVYTGHPYAGVRYFGDGQQPMWPVRNEERRKCLDTLAMIDRHGGRQRFWIGEKGWGLDVKAPPLSDYSRQFAECLVQSMVIAHSVPRVERYFWFLEEGCNEGGYEYGLFRKGMPLPAALAYSTLAGQLHHATPVDSPVLGPNLQTHLFASEDTGLATLVAWSEDGAANLAIADAPAEWRAYDLMGRPSAEGGRGDAVRLALDRAPTYLQVPIAALSDFRQALTEATVSVAVPVRIEAAFAGDTSSLSVRLRNVTPDAHRVSIEAHGVTAEVDVPAATAVTAPLPIPGGLLPLAGQEVGLSVWSAEAEETAAVRLDLPPLEPYGGPEMLSSAEQPLPLAVLDQRGQILPSDPGIGWTGPEDLSARVWAHWWSPEGLVVEVAVRDDQHVAPIAEAGGFWEGDSVQIAIDPLNDAGPQTGFDADDREFGLVLGAEGPRAYMTVPEQKPLECEFSAQRLGQDLISYRIVIPWATLGIEPTPGRIIGLNAIVNDNDGTGRGYWIGVTPGIGESKRPIAYRDVYLAD